MVKWIHARGLQTAADTKDPYVVAFRDSIRGGREEFLLDRLLVAGAIEARGAERFGLVAEALEDGPLKKFYQSITRSEHRHYELFIELAELYIDPDKVAKRWDELLDIEATIAAGLPLRAALH